MKLFIQTLGFSFISLLLSSCSEHTSISFTCEKDAKGNYIVKWEVFPEKDSAQIEIFASNNDTAFGKQATKSTFVNDYIAILSPVDSLKREFFKLKVGRTFSGIISNRSFDMDSIQNFRDAGGYFTRAGKQLRWGLIFRSGNLGSVNEHDKQALESLGIKTVIDLRSSRSVEKRPNLFIPANYIPLPIDVNNFDQAIRDQILDGRFLKGDAHIYTQDCYRSILEDYTAQYTKFFDVLCDESNYPLVFHCGYGKDRTGLAAYFLLKALDVPNDVIEDDYLLTNISLDRLQIANEKRDLPDSMQDAITMLSTADLSQLKYAVSCMKKKSGSVENYMLKELHLTHEKKDKLKKILLYN